MTNSERASYIRGLIDGLELDPAAKETKVFNAMVELLDDLCLSIEDVEDCVAELSEQVDEIDEDLGLWKRITTIWMMAATATTGTRNLATVFSR